MHGTNGGAWRSTGLAQHNPKHNNYATTHARTCNSYTTANVGLKQFPIHSIINPQVSCIADVYVHVHCGFGTISGKIALSLYNTRVDCGWDRWCWHFDDTFTLQHTQYVARSSSAVMAEDQMIRTLTDHSKHWGRCYAYISQTYTPLALEWWGSIV